MNNRNMSDPRAFFRTTYVDHHGLWDKILENLTPSNVSRKERRDIVTDQDVLIEKIITNEIRAAFPDHTIVAEEKYSHSAQSNYTWAIDPIDGTVNFASNFPFSATSICLFENKQPVEGVIYEHAGRRLFHGSKGRGAFVNGTPITVSKKEDLADCIISVMMTSNYSEEETHLITRTIDRLNMRVRGIRIIVCEAMELAFVATGILDGQVCLKPSRYDVGAGALLIEEANGRITDISGQRYSIDSKQVIASNGVVHNQLLEALG
jgi:myo-inositol-1(or 4)-monophosphatase